MYILASMERSFKLRLNDNIFFKLFSTPEKLKLFDAKSFSDFFKKV